jgi:hypothetical protein
MIMGFDIGFSGLIVLLVILVIGTQRVLREY